MTGKTSKSNQDRSAPSQEFKREPIAIIGIGCRYPGGVDSPEKFWSLLCGGIHAVSEIPSSRIDLETYYDSRPATPGKIMTRWGGFLEDIDKFDASFFGISPREAERLDPQQRLLLEVAWEALEDAGQLPKQLNGSRTGVFTGLWLNDFEARLFADPSQTDFYMTTGSGRYSASGRVSYFLGLQGPSITIDTACSSSLVAVHLACQSLWIGESTLALAGGANIILQPHISIAYSQSRMMAPDGRCKFGDAQADGYVRSEGAALIVLKRLSEAIEDGDSIYAVIRGSAVNNDGQSSGFLTTPGQRGQEEMLRVAYQSAGIDPRQVQYVEAHGTGTRAGDPIELAALGAILGKDRPAQTPLLVGSVKTNFGHTEGAAGIAGLIKVALSLKNGMIPPSLHLNEVNPHIPWQDLKLTIPTILTPWSSDEEKIAGVSAFGIAGTNAHIVLEEAPRITIEQSSDEPTYLLPLSAETPEGLKPLAESYRTFLGKEDVSTLHDISYTASSHRTHHTERTAVIGKSHQEWMEQLSSFIEQDVSIQNKLGDQSKVVFVFPGQGAQWTGMGRELLKENQAFRLSLTRCDKALRAWTDWSLLEQLTLDETASNYRLNEISVIQPTLFAMEIALADVWRSWGIEPSAVVGHSMGEVAAAYMAGALSLDDAARIICKRSQLMQRTSGQGAMAVIGLPFAETQKILNGYEEKLSIAVQNSPKATVVSGEPSALEKLMKELQANEIFCRLINVDVASHSPQMDPLVPELVESLHGIQPHASHVPFHSTFMQKVCNGETLDAEYWGGNLRQPVLFGSTIQQLLEDDHAVFIEMSPHPILLSSIEETRSGTDKPAYGFASLRRNQPELATMLGELGSLYALGYNIGWSKLHPNGGKIVSLPSYPWQRERYWFETTAVSKPSRPGAHPLLMQYIHSATGEHIWETTVNPKLFPYLQDHQVRGSVVFPAAGYVEMILAAAKELYGARTFSIKDISFPEALFLSSEYDQILQAVIKVETIGAAEFQIYSRAANDDLSWKMHASGEIEFDNETAATTLPIKNILEQTDSSAADFYSSVFDRGLEYGSEFRAIQSLVNQNDGIVSRIKLSTELTSHASSYQIHPVLADACFQSLLAALPESNQDTYLPILVEKIQIHDRPNYDQELYAHATTTSDGSYITGDIDLFNNDQVLVMSVRGLRMRRVDPKQESVRDLLYEIEWRERAIPFFQQSESKRWLILADDQGVGTALAEHLQRESQICTVVSAGSSQPIDQYFLRNVTGPIHHIVHMWSLDCDPSPSQYDSTLPGILHLTQAIAALDTADAPHLWLVTRGTQSVPLHARPESVSVSQTSVWGMGAVIANEFPNLRCTRVDLSTTTTANEIELLAILLRSDDDEDQVALRNNQRYVARLKQSQLAAENDAKNLIKQKIEQNQSFQVQITTPGIIDGLKLKPVLRKSPQAGQVEINIKATGLNFMNVMAMLGILPGYEGGVGPLGIECAGVISSIGDGTTEFQVGDEVAAIAFDSLASYAVTDARLVTKKPSFINFEEAASLPIAYLTAYYALHHLGRMQKGERVLIHSATGGVGLAAIQFAKRTGTEIFATAGNDEKRKLLKEMGVQHVMDSRSLSFAEEVMKATNGEGVDLVLNSLAGNAIAKGLEILRPYGRFLEIGKRDIYGNSKVGLLPFQRNLSYFAIDLDKMSRERPDIVGQMLHAVFELIETREITALPVQSFPVSKASDGFRIMAQAKHIGKIAISMDDPDASFDVPARATPIHSDATYLITGGLGDLGLTFAQWLAKQGAQHLVLLGRSRPTGVAQKAIDELCSASADITVVQADVTDIKQLAEVFSRIRETLPPLKGIIHAAGLLADGTILQMDNERFAKALAPKVLGAWNLHTLSMDETLDFFVMFSSIAAIVGTPGQVNYAAGNAFMDGLARFRHAQNLPALSINWGPWSGIGLAATQTNRGDRLMQQGLKSISPAQALEVMSLVMAQANPQISVAQLDVQRWCKAQPAAARSSLFKELLTPTAVKVTVKKSNGKDIRAELMNVEAGRQRRTLLDTLIREQVSQVLHLPVSRIPSDKALKTLGLDSLMSIELRNRLEDALGVSLSASLIFNHPTVNALTPFLAEKMGVALDGQSQAAAGKEPEAKLPSSELDDLNKDELEALLAEELSAIDDTLKGSGFDTETGR